MQIIGHVFGARDPVKAPDDQVAPEASSTNAGGPQTTSLSYGGKTYETYRYAGGMKGLIGTVGGEDQLYGECAAGAQEKSGAPNTEFWLDNRQTPTLRELLENNVEIPPGTVFATFSGEHGKYSNKGGDKAGYDHTVMFVSSKTTRGNDGKPVTQVTIASQSVNGLDPVTRKKQSNGFQFHTMDLDHLLGVMSKLRIDWSRAKRNSQTSPRRERVLLKTNCFLACLLCGLLLGGCARYARSTADVGLPLRKKTTIVDGQKWATTFLVGQIFNVQYKLPDQQTYIFTEVVTYDSLPLGSSDEKIMEFYLTGFRSIYHRAIPERIATISTDVGHVSFYRVTLSDEDSLKLKLFAFYQEPSKGSTVIMGFYSEGDGAISLNTARDYINKMYHAKLIPAARNKPPTKP